MAGLPGARGWPRLWAPPDALKDGEARLAGEKAPFAYSTRQPGAGACRAAGPAPAGRQPQRSAVPA